MAFTLRLNRCQIEKVLVDIYEPDKHEIIQQYQLGGTLFPYWSQVWPAAIALAGFLLRHPQYTQGKQVLELAAGLGLPSVIAARNAASVIASDYEPAAIIAMQQTMAHNCLGNVQVQLLDWYHLPDNLMADVLLLSDISYDTALFEVQHKIIIQFLKQGTVIMISTPQRLVAKEAILPLLSFCNYQEQVSMLHHDEELLVTVMVLQL